MDLVLRLLLGIPLVMLIGYFTYLLYSLLVLIGLAVAGGLASVLRIPFRDRRWDLGIGIALVIASIANTVLGWSLGLAVVLYAFLYPTWGGAAEALSFVAAATLMLAWFPAVFFGVLCGALAQDARPKRMAFSGSD